MDKTFYAFGASGTVASSDAQTFGRTSEIPDAAMSGVLLRMPNGSFDSLFVSQDRGGTWTMMPVTLAQTVDCRDVPCVAVPQGILAFVPLAI